MVAGYLRHFLAVLSRSGSEGAPRLAGQPRKASDFFVTVLVSELILLNFEFGHLSGELLHGFGSLSEECSPFWRGCHLKTLNNEMRAE
jgi:hypothetical protein